MSDAPLPQNRRNPRLEAALARLAALLAASAPTGPADPARADPLLVLGVGRSGSTLLTQVLAASGAFAYPSNVVSRFFMRPALGELVQSLLLDPAFDHADQFAALRLGLGGGVGASFASELGKTASPLGPNEFWYFWRRFYDFEAGRTPAADAFTAPPGSGLAAELAEWSDVAGRPVALKATIAAWALDALLAAMPHARAVVVLRDPVDTMIGLVAARVRYWGHADGWYGLRLPAALAAVPTDGPLDEVALQVAAFERFADARRSDPRCDVLSYGKFCADPGLLWRTGAVTSLVARGRIEVVRGAETSFEARPARSETIDRADCGRRFDRYRRLLEDSFG